MASVPCPCENDTYHKVGICKCFCHVSELTKDNEEFDKRFKKEISKNANSGKGDIPASIVSMEVALKDFYEEVEKAISQKAKEKGYSTPNSDTRRELIDFVGKYAPGHSIGEIIYKAIRWTRKHDPEDLIKIAAWAFLVWDNYRRDPFNLTITGFDFGVGESFTIPRVIMEPLTMMEHEMSRPSKEVREAEDHSSESQICKVCCFVKSAHKKDTLMNRLYCPVNYANNDIKPEFQ